MMPLSCELCMTCQHAGTQGIACQVLLHGVACLLMCCCMHSVGRLSMCMLPRFMHQLKVLRFRIMHRWLVTWLTPEPSDCFDFAPCQGM